MNNQTVPLTYRNSRYFAWRSYLLLPLLALFTITGLRAEGTHEVSPSSDDMVMLLVGDENFGNFASPGASESSRLYVQLNGADETLYLGLSREYTNNGTPESTGSYSFRIRRASDDAIVHGPYSVNRFVENISSWDQASGPAVLNGGVGYATDDDRYVFAPGEAGLYYVEFISGDYIGYWDFTVGANGVEVPGRVFSKNWAFRTPPLGNEQPECVWDREFNGALYSYTSDGFVTRIDFAESGFQGLSFTMAFNSTGPGETGDIGQDRMSIPGANISDSFAEHLIFLSEPDPAVYPNGECGELSVAPFFTCTGPGTYCLEVDVTRPGQVEVVIDVNQNDVYDPGVDRRILHRFEEGGPLSTCLDWDGLLGDGTPIDAGASVNLLVQYTQGVQHWTVFDGEFLKEGFCVEPVRPNCSDASGSTDILYWDDRNIPEAPGTGQPKDGRDGCNCETVGCRTWNNFDPQTEDCSVITDEQTTGYGDKNALNTWWFASVVTDALAGVPLISVNIEGEAEVCQGETTPLTFTFTSAGDIASISWTGPSGVIVQGPDAPATIDVSEPGLYTIEIVDENGCSFTGSHVLEQLVCPTDLELDITANDLTPDMWQTVTFDITVTNQGPHIAGDFTVNTSWPEGITNVQIISGGGTFNGTSIDWENLSLGIGESLTLTFTGRVVPGFDHTVSAEITYSAQDDPDSTPGNGVDTNGNDQCADDPGDEDDGDCVQLTPPPCSVNVEILNVNCFDSLTPSDPTDDTYGFTMLVTSAYGAGTWTAEVNGQTVSGNYGLSVSYSGYEISNGDLDIVVMDELFGDNCSTQVTVEAPETCSSDCVLTIETRPAVCDDAGTAFDPSDDTYSFEFRLSGLNTSSGWNASDGSSGDYDVWYTYSDNLVADGDVSLTFIDNEEGACSVAQTFTAPDSCSPDCLIELNVGAAICDNNNTPSDPSDDTFSFTVEATGWNVGAANWVADDPNASTGAFGTVVELGPYPISGGDVSFSISDPTNASCSAPVAVSAPNTCSDVCALTLQQGLTQCQNNGTDSDPSDDTFTVLIRITGANASTSWTASNGQGGEYGQWVLMGPFPISEGDVTLSFTDDELEGCSVTATLVAPPNCSSTCAILDASYSNVVCDDNGTPTDPSDDTFTFDVELIGANVGAEWTASDGTTGAYATSVSFGPFDINDGDVSLSFVDQNDELCTAQLTIPAPATCSDECAIIAMASNYQCSDNGTPFDPGDDVFTFDLTVEAINAAGPGWIQPSGNSGTYGQTYAQGPFSIAEGAFSMVVEDVNDATCTASVTINPPAPCSNDCIIFAQVVESFCDDRGTPDDSSDDEFTYSLLVNGANTGSGWVASDGTTGNYNEVVQSISGHAYADGILELIVSDRDGTCSDTLIVSAPAPALICPDDTDRRSFNTGIQVLQGQLGEGDQQLQEAPCFLALSSTPILLGDRFMEPIDIETPDGEEINVDTSAVYNFFFFTDIPLVPELSPFGQADGTGMIFRGDFSGYDDPCCFSESHISNLDAPVDIEGLPLLIDTTGMFDQPMYLVQYFTHSLRLGESYSLVASTYSPGVSGNYAWVVVAGIEDPLVVNSPTVTSEYFPEQQVYEDLTYFHIPWAQDDEESMDQLGYVVFDPLCGVDTLYFADNLERLDNCEDSHIIRTFTMEYGGQADSCDQDITFRRPGIEDVILPPSTVTFQCGDDYTVNENGYPDPLNTGYPLISNGTDYDTLFEQTIFFNLAIAYKDIPQPDTTGLALDLTREWSVVDACNGDTLYVIPQQIKVGQFGPPRLICPSSTGPCSCPEENIVIFGLDPLECTATVDLPLAELVGFCDESRAEDWSITTELIRDVDESLLETIPFDASRSVSNLERGQYTLRYIAEDLDGNQVERSCQMRIQDFQQPTAICRSSLTIVVDGDTPNVLSPAELDLGSYDNCGTPSLLIRREYNEGTESCNGGLAGTFSPWANELSFDCCDAGQTFQLELQVMDADSNINGCNVLLNIVDEVDPVLSGLEELNISCNLLPHDFEPMDSLQRNTLFGMPTVSDNCSATIVEMDPELSWDDCQLGSLTRKFMATDLAGNVTPEVYEQHIEVAYSNSYGIRFPKDVTAACIEEADQIEFLGGGCGDFEVFFEDTDLDPEGEECLRIQRTFTVINNCQYDGVSLPSVLERNEDCDVQDGEEDLWLVVEDGSAFIDADSDIANNYPPAGVACGANPLGYWRSLDNVGAWTYRQIIKIMNEEEPSITYDVPTVFCADGGACEGEVSISLNIIEQCLPERTNVRLYLDEGNDGNTDQDLTSSGVINSVNDRYMIEGTFPRGNHAFVVEAEDACGNLGLQRIAFTVADCYIAQPVCVTELEVQLEPVMPAQDVDGDGIMDEAAVMLAASDLADMTGLDCSGAYSYSVTELGAVARFEADQLILTCEDRYQAIRDIVVRDNANNPYAEQPDGSMGGPNYKRCTVIISVQDEDEICTNCADSELIIDGAVRTRANMPLSGVQMDIFQNDELTTSAYTLVEGEYEFPELEFSNTYKVRPYKNDDTANGVTTLDMIALARHLAGQQVITDPYVLLAADIDANGVVNWDDFNYVGDLMLDRLETWPNNTSWRFLPADYELTDIGADIPDFIEYDDLSACQFGQDFIGIKIGDLNGSVGMGNVAGQAEQRHLEQWWLQVPNYELQAGDLYRIPIRVQDLGQLSGLDLTLDLNTQGLEVLEIEEGLLSTGQINSSLLDRGQLHAIWVKQNEQMTGEPLFTLVVRAQRSQPLAELLELSSNAEGRAYDRDLTAFELQLEYVDQGHEAVLLENRPDPFQEQTQIEFFLPQSGQYLVEITDSRGKVLRRYQQQAAAGRQQLTIFGDDLPKGVLFYTLTFKDRQLSRKMVKL